MIKDLRSSINQLSESEAKTILLQTMIRLALIQESKEPPQQMIDDLHSWYKGILTFSENNRKVEREYKAVHIVCGESPAGSLRVGLGRENKVIGFPDFFAVGPIRELHNEAGRKSRYEWLRDHLNYPNDFIEEEYESRFSKTLAEIDGIPAHVPIVIWTAENADEQTGMRYLLYLLREKSNDVFLINTTIAFQELFNTSEYQYYYFHTGEVQPEKLNTIYQEKLKKPLAIEERIQFEKEWIALSKTTGIVRIWEGNKIQNVNENYFDDLIVSTAQKLHAKQKEKEFIKSGRIIGDVYGQIDTSVSDAFLEYRLRSLVYEGVFEIKGIPKGMRYYSVKLR